MPKRSRQTQIGKSGRVIKSRGGVSHGKRNSRDKTQAKKAARKSSDRVVTSLEEVRAHQREINRLAATPEAISERAETSGHRGHSRCTKTNCTWYQPNCPVVEHPGIENVELPEKVVYLDPILDALKLPDMPRDAQGSDFTMGEARTRFRKGYHISHIMRTTGWGFNYFDDLVSADGYVKEDEAL